MKPGTLEEIRTALPTVPLQLLIVQPSAHDVELILNELKEAGVTAECTMAQNREQFSKALRIENFDAVIADYCLPDWTGMEALKELQANGKNTPFLLVTRALGEEAAVECIKQGVSDYILKDHIARLPIALTRALHEKILRDEAEKAHQALAASVMRNCDLVENSIYGISHIGRNGAFLDANPALLSMLGCASLRELQALNLLSDIFRFPEQYGQLLRKCWENGQVRGGEAEWRRRDGGIVAVRLHLRQLRLANHLETIEIIAEDVTKLKAMERQLRQAQKFEVIGQLAGGVAHDFSNVVGAILGWAELGYEQNRGDPQAAEHFARIREQAERAATLTRELLTFARRQALQPSAVDLNDVTSGLVSFLDRVIAKDIELKVITAPLDAVKADPTQLEQVLMNLCLNARDAMPDGGRLLIETEMVELDDSYCRFYPYISPGRYAVLSVSDTGKGMDAETRERIFEPFFTTKERGEGTGMGLATVYGIVKQHGGFIHVYSEIGQGSLFRIYVPTLAGLAGESISTKVPAPSFGEMRGSETILVAEDHESIREMARQTLANLGYRVLAAGDGAEALHLCENETPALAILDVIMPRLGGPATGAKLMERFDGLPILFTSGYSQDVRNILPKEGDTRYLQKPYSPTALGRIVREILDDKKQDEKSHRGSFPVARGAAVS
ncbi:MAG TPA: response regulator [Candidatus Acidoferrum sp.]|nr:response regulator [Candidatus Acidoferrum sp.]